MQFTDQMNRVVRLEKVPERIVSLVPSQTELLYDLGLGDRVVGITKFCVHPNDWFRNKTRVGGTKSVDFDKIKSLHPDLIIGNKEENEKSDIDRLTAEFPVWMSDIFTLSDAMDMIQHIGAITGTEKEAKSIVTDVQNGFSELEKWVNESFKEDLSVAYFIWKDPDFCAGPNTFIDAMLHRCGLKNYIQETRYPEFSVATDQAPDVIFLSSEPYPFKEKHVLEFQEKFPNAKIQLVDGEMFSWYGSRLKHAPKYFQNLLEQLTSD